jgi:hypothetical protein
MFEFGWTTEDEMFLVMEFVEGVGLALLVDLSLLLLRQLVPQQLLLRQLPFPQTR